MKDSNALFVYFCRPPITPTVHGSKLFKVHVNLDYLPHAKETVETFAQTVSQCGQATLGVH